MATTQEKTTPTCCINNSSKPSATEPVKDWKVSGSDPSLDPVRKRDSVTTLIRPVESLPDPPPPPNTISSTKGFIFYLLLISFVSVIDYSS